MSERGTHAGRFSLGAGIWVWCLLALWLMSNSELRDALLTLLFCLFLPGLALAQPHLLPKAHSPLGSHFPRLPAAAGAVPGHNLFLLCRRQHAETDPVHFEPTPCARPARLLPCHPQGVGAAALSRWVWKDLSPLCFLGHFLGSLVIIIIPSLMLILTFVGKSACLKQGLAQSFVACGLGFLLLGASLG